MSKPLYAGNDPDPVDIEMAGLHPATRSEIIEAAIEVIPADYTVRVAGLPVREAVEIVLHDMKDE